MEIWYKIYLGADPEPIRDADTLGADALFSEAVPEEGVGLAVMNRLGRAAAFHIVDAAPEAR